MLGLRPHRALETSYRTEVVMIMILNKDLVPGGAAAVHTALRKCNPGEFLTEQKVDREETHSDCGCSAQAVEC